MAKADTKPTNASPLKNPQVIVAVVIALLVFFAIASLINAQNRLLREQQTAPLTPTPTSRPLPTKTPEPTTTITEFDARDPDFQKNLDAYFIEYCKNNPCNSPSPKPTDNTQSKKIDLNEKSYCYVEKNGSFEMTAKECQELHDKNPREFQIQAYINCVDGKIPAVGDSGTQDSRKQKCSDLMGIVEN